MVFNKGVTLVFCGNGVGRPKRETNGVEEEIVITYVPHIA
jgi:hypothetical protein